MDKLKVVTEYNRPVAADRRTKLLQTYDANLTARWVWQKERWGVFTKDQKGKEYLVFIVENPNGTFRDIDQRSLLAIKKADLYRRERTDTILKEVEDNNSAVEAAKLKKLRNDVEAISKERWRWTMSNKLIPVG